MGSMPWCESACRSVPQRKPKRFCRTIVAAQCYNMIFRTAILMSQSDQTARNWRPVAKRRKRPVWWRCGNQEKQLRFPEEMVRTDHVAGHAASRVCHVLAPFGHEPFGSCGGRIGYAAV